MYDTNGRRKSSNVIDMRQGASKGTTATSKAGSSAVKTSLQASRNVSPKKK